MLGDGADKFPDYEFLGDDIASQSENIRLLAEAMRTGRSDLATSLPKLVDLDLENWAGGADDAVATLFGEADWISYGTEQALAAEAGESILDDLVSAADYLLEFVL